MKNRSRGQTNLRPRGNNRRCKRRSSDREMECLRLFRLQRLQFLFAAIAASNFAKRNSLVPGICVERVRRFLRRRGQAIFLFGAFRFVRFDEGAIGRRQNLCAGKIFVGVDVSRVRVLRLFARLFLARGIRNALCILLLSAGNAGAKSSEAHQSENRA